MDFKLIKEPDIEDDHPTLRSLASAINALSPDQEDPVLTLFPSENIEGSTQLQLYVSKESPANNVEYQLTIMLEESDEEKCFRYSTDSKDEMQEIFYNYFTANKLPDFRKWTDDTESHQESMERFMQINIFKESYHIVRKNGKEIYKGFGFKHHSDVTQYYVHPNNQSADGTTSLCQPIGESIVLFATLLSGIIKGDSNKIGDYSYNDDKSCFGLAISVPDDWHNAGIIDKNIVCYKAYLDDHTIYFGAFGNDGVWIYDKIEPLESNYKLSPCFIILLAREMEINPDFSSLVQNFIESPAADVFVNIHEDFYQNHKNEDYYLDYGEVKAFDTSKFTTCSSTYDALRENRKSINRDNKIEIFHFPTENFLLEYLDLIPALTEEFELPKELHSLCNAVQSGDSRATLFHGPAGTGKTISCKLICQSIGLPIMDTVNCTENLDEFILGKYIPQDNKIVFMESYVTKAIRYGGAVVFEEINFAKPQYLSFLNSLLDDNGFVRLDNGEIVKRHTNFRFFATMNLGYFGTKQLNQALFNRFNSVIELAALSDDSIRKMLFSRVPECVPFIDKMLSVYHKLKKKIESEELEIVISPRNLENWARLARHEGYLRASEKTIIPIAKNDRILENAIKGIIYLYRWT